MPATSSPAEGVGQLSSRLPEASSSDLHVLGVQKSQLSGACKRGGFSLWNPPDASPHGTEGSRGGFAWSRAREAAGRLASSVGHALPVHGCLSGALQASLERVGKASPRLGSLLVPSDRSREGTSQSESAGRAGTCVRDMPLRAVTSARAVALRLCAPLGRSALP